MIVGSDGAFARVRLPQDARVHAILDRRSLKGPTDSVQVNGPGRAVGILLIADPPESIHENFLLAGRLSECGEPGCGPGKRVINFQFPSRYPQGPGKSTVSLPQGLYRLYLIADRKPVRIVLQLEGLRGRTRIAPSRKVPLDLKTPEQRHRLDDGMEIYAAGSTYEGGERGVILAGLFARGADETDYDFGICQYAGINRPPDEIAYGPHCSALAVTGGSGSFGSFSDTKDFTLVFLTDYERENAFPPNLDGKYGLGAWVSADSPLRAVGSQAFFLPYEP